ncbi:ArsR/SmtB family transcription factor [Arthrobacter sp. HLT1-20]
MVVEKVFAVIAESTRRDILEALAQESKAVGQLVDELGVSQPTVSKHLRVLREAGVVTMRAQGQKRFYGINTEPLALVASWLESLGATAPGLSGVAPAQLPSAAPLDGRAATPPQVAAAVPAAVPSPVTEVPPAEKLLPAASNGARVPTLAAPAHTATSSAPGASAAASGVTGARATGVVPSSQAAVVVHSNENDGGVPGQISRSVGRAANKAADLLANLPALPTFRRRKD